MRLLLVTFPTFLYIYILYIIQYGYTERRVYTPLPYCCNQYSKMIFLHPKIGKKETCSPFHPLVSHFLTTIFNILIFHFSFFQKCGFLNTGVFTDTWKIVPNYLILLLRKIDLSYFPSFYIWIPLLYTKSLKNILTMITWYISAKPPILWTSVGNYMLNHIITLVSLRNPPNYIISFATMAVYTNLPN